MIEFFLPITVVPRSTAWTVFARLNAWIVSSNPNEGMDVCIVCVYSVFRQRTCDGLIPVQGVLPTVYGIKTETVAKAQQTAVEP
jgi:hypothetical protein